MQKFIRLTTTVINSNYINRILILPNKYYIYMNNHKIDGSIILGSGGVSSTEEYIEVCVKANKEDYKIISNWIDNIK